MPLVLSKNWFCEQVGKHRPLDKTGREEGQVRHWEKEDPEHVAQSGWHEPQVPPDENVPPGQLETHLPLDACWFEGQLRQNVLDPEQVLHDESQAVQVKLSLATNVPLGQLPTHWPLLRNEPGKHAVHCNWETVEATENEGI